MTRAEAHRLAMMALINTEPARNATPHSGRPSLSSGKAGGSRVGVQVKVPVDLPPWLAPGQVSGQIVRDQINIGMLDLFLY